MQINGEKVAIFWCKVYGVKVGREQQSCGLVDASLLFRGYRRGLLAGIAARTESSDGEYEKHLRAEPQDWTGGGNFARHCRELN